MAIYFASDFHLGLDTRLTSSQREKRIIRWLDDIRSDLDELFLIGDCFDYWFEYKNVVPKGHLRFMAKLAEIRDAGIAVHMFTGNHDLWMKDYFVEEIGVELHRKPISIKRNNSTFFIAHGDGLGPGDRGYKFIKRIFSSSFNQWLFRRIHPDTGIAIMKYFSKKSRESEMQPIPFKGPDKEWLIQYAEEQSKIKHHDFYIFGHRHLPLDIKLSNGQSRYVNTGDWLHHFSYARFNDGDLRILSYEDT